jgi:hypothetical protein
MKEDKIQEPKPIGKDPAEFQELDSGIIRKRIKLKPRRPVQVPIDIGVQPGSMSYVFSQEPSVLEQEESNIESTVKHKGKKVLNLPYSDTESLESETTPTISAQQSILVTKLDILTKEALNDLDMCNIPDIKSMQNRNKMLEMEDEQQYNQNNTTIIPK